MNCIGCPMVCKIFFCSKFTVRIPPYSGKVVVRRRREVITQKDLWSLWKNLTVFLRFLYNDFSSNYENPPEKAKKPTVNSGSYSNSSDLTPEKNYCFFRPALINTCFFISNAFFQLSLNVAYVFHKLSFKCCLGVA